MSAMTTSLLAAIYGVTYFGFGFGSGNESQTSSSQLDPSIFQGVLIFILVFVADRLIYKLWRPYRTYGATMAANEQLEQDHSHGSREDLMVGADVELLRELKDWVHTLL